jgi:dethiobiotin synthetase
MMPAIFVTGTGTDIGKTYVTAGLVRALRKRKTPVLALKPIVSGFDPGAPSGSDPALLLEAMGRPVSAAEIERISPFRFRAPLSPDMAARREQNALDFEAVAKFCAAAIAPYDGVLLLEGVGGILVPLNETKTMLDLMVSLQLPLLLVTGSYLGSISHLLSALEVIAHRALELRAIIVNETEGSSVPFDELLWTLKSFTSLPLLALRRLPAQENERTFAELLDLAQLNLTQLK